MTGGLGGLGGNGAGDGTSGGTGGSVATGGTSPTSGTGGIGAVGGSGGNGAIGGSGGGAGRGGSGGGDDGGAGGGAGVGGVGGNGAGGQGGSGGVPTCMPGQSVSCLCADGRTGAQVCRSDSTLGECICPVPDGGPWEVQQLARLRRGIVGRWTGLQHNPWDFITGPCTCTVSFSATNYTGHSIGDRCTVFNWGTNMDSPLKIYGIDSASPEGVGKGRLTLFWDAGTTNEADILDLNLSNDENELQFKVMYAGSGPLEFSLKRAP